LNPNVTHIFQQRQTMFSMEKELCISISYSHILPWCWTVKDSIGRRVRVLRQVGHCFRICNHCFKHG
jgi:hypothetical protein